MKSSLRSRRLEVVGIRKNRRARRRHACLPRPFFLSPTTSKRLLRRLDFTCRFSVHYVHTEIEHFMLGSSQSERFLILVLQCGTKPQIFEVSGATADQLPPLILSGAYWPGNWTPFDSNFVSVSDERGSVINDYL